MNIMDVYRTFPASAVLHLHVNGLDVYTPPPPVFCCCFLVSRLPFACSVRE